ncbi:MAG TPA: helix-turn-helix domain-containing protein [Methylomirabilota bacterium]|nr:helix-turn-helix domain-containing protein [Methylomirabilota bacterium]
MTEQPQHEHLYLPSEVAHQLRISVRLVYLMISRGELRHTRIYRQIRIPASEVERALARGVARIKI